VRELVPYGAIALDEDAPHRLVLMDPHPRAGGGGLQGRRELAIVDLMVLRAPYRPGDCGEVRLPSPRFLRGNPFDRQLQRLLELQVMVDAGLIVRGERDDERSLAAQIDRLLRDLLQFRGKV